MSALKLNGTSDYIDTVAGFNFPQDASVVKATRCWVRSAMSGGTESGEVILERRTATVDGAGNATAVTGASLGDIYLGAGESLILEKVSGEVWNLADAQGATGKIRFAPVAVGG
jgi:hypothetical protein